MRCMMTYYEAKDLLLFRLLQNIKELRVEQRLPPNELNPVRIIPNTEKLPHLPERGLLGRVKGVWKIWNVVAAQLAIERTP